ncbi:MAG: acyltransferase [Vicinamibacterales bacterium]
MHIPSLDGIRAVSFAIVFMAHSGLPGIPGGFGVTVFFFLSGYLITTLMRLERQSTGRVSIRKFYMRRALRILPPFYLILLLSSALTIIGVLPGALRAGPLLAQGLHVFNYWFIYQGSNGTPVGTVPYWSLAVEEHFYLIFPVLYMVLSRSLPRRSQAAVVWILCGVICVWRCALVLGMGVPENRTYMASDTRFDSILFGCALAIGLNPVLDEPRGSDGLWKWLLLPAGIALLVVTFVYRAPWFRETIRYTIQGISLTPVFVTTIRFPGWLPFRPLNWAPIAFLGVLSYTLYLNHQIAILGVHFWLPTLPLPVAALLSFGIAFLVALSLHQFVEKPLARLRQRIGRGVSAAGATRVR